MNIPLTKTFNISHESKVDGQTYTGTFVTKKLNQLEKLRVGVVKSKLTEGLSYDPDTQRGLGEYYDLQADAIAMCMVALKEKPDWFKPEELIDSDLLWLVYKEVNAFEREIFQRPPAAGTPATQQNPVSTTQV